jgi:hypothetical protein
MGQQTRASSAGRTANRDEYGKVEQKFSQARERRPALLLTMSCQKGRKAGENNAGEIGGVTPMLALAA